jgi:hypothetical protein
MVVPGQQHVFYRGTDGDIHHLWWSESDNTTRTDDWTQKAHALGSAPSDVACDATNVFPST